jgi:hypothetical protein
MKHWTLVATLSLALASGAFAQTETPRVDQRQAHQQQRIDQGVASGSLTGNEAARLHHGQARVAAAEDNAKADGTVTKHEKAHLAHMQKKQGRHIKHQKHDRQKVTPLG